MPTLTCCPLLPQLPPPHTPPNEHATQLAQSPLTVKAAHNIQEVGRRRRGAVSQMLDCCVEVSTTTDRLHHAVDGRDEGRQCRWDERPIGQTTADDVKRSTGRAGSVREASASGTGTEVGGVGGADHVTTADDPRDDDLSDAGRESARATVYFMRRSADGCTADRCTVMERMREMATRGRRQRGEGNTGWTATRRRQRGGDGNAGWTATRRRQREGDDRRQREDEGNARAAATRGRRPTATRGRRPTATRATATRQGRRRRGGY